MSWSLAPSLLGGPPGPTDPASRRPASNITPGKINLLIQPKFITVQTFPDVQDTYGQNHAWKYKVRVKIEHRGKLRTMGGYMVAVSASFIIQYMGPEIHFA